MFTHFYPRHSFCFLSIKSQCVTHWKIFQPSAQLIHNCQLAWQRTRKLTTEKSKNWTDNRVTVQRCIVFWGVVTCNWRGWNCDISCDDSATQTESTDWTWCCSPLWAAPEYEVPLTCSKLSKRSKLRSRSRRSRRRENFGTFPSTKTCSMSRFSFRGGNTWGVQPD